MPGLIYSWGKVMSSCFLCVFLHKWYHNRFVTAVVSANYTVQQHPCKEEKPFCTGCRLITWGGGRVEGRVGEEWGRGAFVVPVSLMCTWRVQFGHLISQCGVPGQTVGYPSARHNRGLVAQPVPIHCIIEGLCL